MLLRSLILLCVLTAIALAVARTTLAQTTLFQYLGQTRGGRRAGKR